MSDIVDNNLYEAFNFSVMESRFQSIRMIMLEEIRVKMMARIMDKEHKTYNCRSWKLSGIPCPHACSAIWHLEQEHDDYLHRYYHKETYMKAYAYALQPINELHEWRKSGIELVLLPIEKIKLGRPKKNRRKEKMN
ncbi:hypothetical protein J1N35_034130 [Gossypium stocksii]|uniref:Zinc finger PMZ-type domain-containing protein n=1 Tax=Gossypium stocksii TaxID=47602 RepID=A0A9D3ZQE8_9ROSI|nr:hypothetical protein J1N35_034130 [Gossypium stocksii]